MVASVSILDRVSSSDLWKVGVSDYMLPKSVIHLRVSFGVFPQLLVVVVQRLDNFSVQACMIGHRNSARGRLRQGVFPQAILHCAPVVIRGCFNNLVEELRFRSNMFGKLASASIADAVFSEMHTFAEGEDRYRAGKSQLR